MNDSRKNNSPPLFRIAVAVACLILIVGAAFAIRRKSDSARSIHPTADLEAPLSSSSATQGSECSTTSSVPSPAESDILPRPETNLEFWIGENVDDADWSNFIEKYGLFGGVEYYGSAYVPTVDENDQQVDPEQCVIYTVTAYPDYSDHTHHITLIYISDPSVEFYGISLRSTFEEVIACIEQQGFVITDSRENYVRAENGKFWISFTKECIHIGVRVTNNQGIVF